MRGHGGGGGDSGDPALCQAAVSTPSLAATSTTLAVQIQVNLAWQEYGLQATYKSLSLLV